MANPQKENGHIGIANEIAERLAMTHLSGSEHQILWVIWRKTYGWHKKEDWISLSQFVEATKMREPHICRAIKLLIKQNIITKKGDREMPVYSIQKNYDLWVKLPKGVRSHHKLKLPKGVIQITKGGNSNYQRGQIQKKLPTKETITKENMLSKKKKTKKKTTKQLLKTSKLGYGEQGITGKPSPMQIKIEKKHEGTEFGKKVISLGYEFNRWYHERFSEDYKKGSFSVSGIAKNISKYSEYERLDWLKIMEYYFKSKKAKELVVTLEACFSEHTILSYKQGKGKIKKTNAGNITGKGVFE